MRSRLLLKLVSALVMLVLTVAGARSLTHSSPSSPANPVNLARNGLAGICAEEQATAAAGDQPDAGASPATAVPPGALAQLQARDPAGVAALERAAGGTLTCPPPATDTGP